MTVLWSVMVVVTVIVVGSLFMVVVRKPRENAADRLNYDVAIYKDQLAELERDLESGVISKAETEAARTEIERRLLGIAAVASDANEAKSATGGKLVAIVFIGFGLPVITAALYLHLGSPNYPNAPYAGRDISAERESQERRQEGQKMAGLVKTLAERMEREPTNLQGWLLLGRTYLTMEREEDAVAALRKAVELAPKDPSVATELAEALVIAANNRVGEEAHKIFKGVLSSDARAPRARYYLALADAQDGKLRDALQGWTDLLAVSPSDAPWRNTVTQRIQNTARDLKIDPASVKASLSAKLLGPDKPKALPAQPYSTAPGPNRSDIEAADQMLASERAEMIRGMVQRLADRMTDNPDDLEGWQRLAKAYRVLGKTKKVRAAEAQIKRLSQ